MKESIYTIPLTQVFENPGGCPVCALQEAVETRWVQYITGPAMMEPDVRVQTNKRGFCARHLTAMTSQRNRLSVALQLQTRLQTLLDAPPTRPRSRLGGRGGGEKEPACFLCHRVEGELRRLAGNIAEVWGREEAFRRLYDAQPFICLPHHRLLVRCAPAGRAAGPYLAATDALLHRGLARAREEIDAFCKLYDYRSPGAGEVPPEVAAAVERAGQVLCGLHFSAT